MGYVSRQMRNHFITLTAAGDFHLLPGHGQQHVSHLCNLRAKPEAGRQPQPIGLFQPGRTERIIRTTKTINLLVAITNQHNPTGLTQDKGTGDRIGVLASSKRMVSH